jgi:hypothetical protein
MILSYRGKGRTPWQPFSSEAAMIPYTSIKYDPAKGYRAYASRGGARVQRWLGPWRKTRSIALRDRTLFHKKASA